MARKGRQPWSNRIIVEDCLAFDIANLVRSGIFRAKPGSLCAITWKNHYGQETLRAYFWVEWTLSEKKLLHIDYGAPGSVPLMHHARSATIEIAQTPLHFGPRPWFLCPGVHNDAPCRKRVRILYFTPVKGRLGCRTCLYLIHKSARQHDKRIDALAKLSPLDIRLVLRHGNDRQKLLAVRANWVVLQRLRKKLDRQAFGRQKVPLRST
jgi:hypothetical protein